MNPDPIAVEAYRTGYERGRQEYEAKRQQSRAAQPRRKDNKNRRPTRVR